SKRRSERFVQQRGNGGPIGVADRTAGFMLALERDQGRLHAYAESPHGVFLAVEIDNEENEVLELGIRRELAQNWFLLGADRTPGGVDINKNRLARLLRRCKGFRGEGLGFCSQRR